MLGVVLEIAGKEVGHLLLMMLLMMLVLLFVFEIAGKCGSRCL